VEWAPVDVLNKQFRTCWRGLDPRQVEAFLQQVGDDMQRLQVENANLRKDLQRQEKELKEHRDREKIIRNLLVNTQKSVEQMKANAEKEAKLVIAEAELSAEKMVRGAQQRLDRLHEDIAELKAHRVQLEIKIRATLDAYRILLDNMAKDEEENHAENKVKVLNR
jgi:cell division initiation protein